MLAESRFKALEITPSLPAERWPRQAIAEDIFLVSNKKVFERYDVRRL